MFWKFSRKIDTIFLDPNVNKFNTIESVNVILSPELYWVKKVSLPVKNVRSVRPLIKSLFEGTLPEGEYSYSAYKQDEEYYIFAYEDKGILSLLESKGIKASQVHNVYFAQSEFVNITDAIKINASQSMYVEEGIVVLLPSLWVEKHSDLDLNNFVLSKNFIVLKQYTHIVNDKHIYAIGSILILLVMITMIEYFIVHKKISEVESMRTTLFEKTTLKPTMMQSHAMLSEYKLLHTRQKKLREYIGFITAIQLQRDEKLSFVGLKKNKIKISFTGVIESRKVAIEATLKKANIPFKTQLKQVSLDMEIDL